MAGNVETYSAGTGSTIAFFPVLRSGLHSSRKPIFIFSSSLLLDLQQYIWGPTGSWASGVSVSGWCAVSRIHHKYPPETIFWHEQLSLYLIQLLQCYMSNISMVILVLEMTAVKYVHYIILRYSRNTQVGNSHVSSDQQPLSVTTDYRFWYSPNGRSTHWRGLSGRSRDIQYGTLWSHNVTNNECIFTPGVVERSSLL